MGCAKEAVAATPKQGTLLGDGPPVAAGEADRGSERQPGSLAFTIEYRGKPQGRKQPFPVVAKSGPKKGKAFLVTAHNTRAFESEIKQLAALQMGNRPPSERPFELVIHAYFEIPTSWPRWKLALLGGGRLRHASKPDADNIAKAVKDALKGIVWRDDAQVSDSHQHKRFSDVPRVVIEVSEIEGVYPSNIKTKPSLGGDGSA